MTYLNLNPCFVVKFGETKVVIIIVVLKFATTTIADSLSSLLIVTIEDTNSFGSTFIVVANVLSSVIIRTIVIKEFATVT